MQSLTDVDISGLTYFKVLPEEISLGGARGLLARTGYSGELGYEFFSHPDEIGSLYDARNGNPTFRQGLIDDISAATVLKPFPFRKVSENRAT